MTTIVAVMQGRYGIYLRKTYHIQSKYLHYTQNMGILGLEASGGAGCHKLRMIPGG